MQYATKLNKRSKVKAMSMTVQLMTFGDCSLGGGVYQIIGCLAYH